MLILCGGRKKWKLEEQGRKVKKIAKAWVGWLQITDNYTKVCKQTFNDLQSKQIRRETLLGNGGVD